MKESAFTKDCCKIMEQKGALIYPIVAHQMSEPGWPDRMICFNGWIALLEFKGVKTPLEDNQKFLIHKLERRNVPVWVCRDYGEGACGLYTSENRVVGTCHMNNLLMTLDRWVLACGHKVIDWKKR